MQLVSWTVDADSLTPLPAQAAALQSDIIVRRANQLGPFAYLNKYARRHTSGTVFGQTTVGVRLKTEMAKEWGFEAHLLLPQTLSWPSQRIQRHGRPKYHSRVTAIWLRYTRRPSLRRQRHNPRVLVQHGLE